MSGIELALVVVIPLGWLIILVAVARIDKTLNEMLAILQRQEQSAGVSEEVEASPGSPADLAKLEPYTDAWMKACSSPSTPSNVLLRCGDYLIKAAGEWAPADLARISWEVYQVILGQLHSRPDLRAGALEIGRTAYRVRHRSGALGLEQAIHNDLMVNSMPSPPLPS
jgi:hypothetical protein